MDNIIKVDFENNFSSTNDLNIIIDNDNLINRHEFYSWNNATEYVNSLIDSIDIDTLLSIMVKSYLEG